MNDANNTCFVGWTQAGEWLEFDVTVPATATYVLTARTASQNTNKTLQFYVDGALKGAVTAPSSGWQNYHERSGNAELTAGPHTIRVLFNSGDTNLNYIDLRPVLARKGLAVIVDYANTTFENYTGAGINSEAQLITKLTSMKGHWSWLSRYQEKFDWTVQRVKLPVNLTPGTPAYPSVDAFRDAVMQLVKQQVSAASFDGDNDGNMDAVWAVVSLGSTPQPDYAAGGMTRNLNANMFVDGQASGAMQGASIGPFNHEVGHCVGLPDLYGDYSNIFELSLMSNVWESQPADFSAYEREKLGWTVPSVVSASTTGLVLTNTTNSFDSLRVQGRDASEYFLIEYRDRPNSGVGSAAAEDFNGLAVYHVLTGSGQSVNPPFYKLEPASSSTVHGEGSRKITDLAYNGNPQLRNPLNFRTYFGNGELFRLQNVVIAGGTATFDLVLSNPSSTLPNLLPNPSFETPNQNGTGPLDWSFGSWAQTATSSWITTTPSQGTRSVGINATTGDDAKWYRTVPGLTVDNSYYLCGMLRGQNIVNVKGSTGGSLFTSARGSLISESLSGTFPWTRRCVTVFTDTTAPEVGCRLGYFGSEPTGSLWCDDLSLRAISKAY